MGSRMCLKATRQASGLLATAVAFALAPDVARAQSGHGSHGSHDHGAAKTAPAKPDGRKASAERPEKEQVVGAADASMSGHEHGDMNARFHMEMTPTRPATREDSIAAERVVADLRAAIAKYRDTAVAVADGYKMFMPNVKTQRVYHFTNGRRAFAEAFRFDPTKPTSLLYRRAADGTLELYGAMYTAPKRLGVEKLDERIPLSIARWHKHVNWCIPKAGQRARWFETRDGHPVFGPQSPIATREACEAVDGRFLPNIFGWMVHVNAFADRPSAVWEH
jgi:hypothetical protein